MSRDDRFYQHTRPGEVWLARSRMLYHSSTKMKFCNFPKTGPKPLDILESLWHNTPVANNDEQTASGKQTS